jgi:hypothetical protein
MRARVSSCYEPVPLPMFLVITLPPSCMGGVMLLGVLLVACTSFPTDVEDAGSSNPGDDVSSRNCAPGEQAFVDDGLAHSSLGEAVAAAESGSVVTVCPGEHVVQLDIGTDLTLVGPEGPEATVLVAEPGHRVVSVVGAAVSLVGLSVVGGEGGYGGGVRVRDGALVVQDCLIRDNHASTLGGGLLVERSSLLVQSSEIVNNVAVEGGGGLSIDGQGGPWEIDKTKIDGNEALYGGGLQLTGDVLVTGSEVTNNQAEQGGGIHMGPGTLRLVDTQVATNGGSEQGGGVYLLSGTSDEFHLQCTGSTFIRMNAADSGGGIAVTNEADGFVETPKSSVVGCTVDKNSAVHGGGVAVALKTAVRLEDLSIRSNSGTTAGGIASFGWIDGANLSIVENEASAGVGGIGHAGNWSNSVFWLADSTIERNVGTTAGGFQVLDGFLQSINSDWGEGDSDNVPVDAHFGGVEHSFGEKENFFCGSTKCEE